MAERNANGRYRRAVQISHPGSEATVSEYQVDIKLDGSFDFTKAAGDGHDLRVTAADGTTPIPFWIETWNPAESTASIWVKVPSIPVAGTTVYLYYGNNSATTPTATPVPVPPTGPFTKDSNNPQVISGGPSCWRGSKTPELLPENMVMSGATYYLVATDRQCDAGGIDLLSAPSPDGPWTFDKRILTRADLHAQGEARDVLDSPHLVQDGTNWYLFYSHFYGAAPYWDRASRRAPIGLAESTNGIDGQYRQINPNVLPAGGTGSWDAGRVCEPYVLRTPSGWVMVYMGDASAAGGFTEQVGIATSTNGIGGPYVKSPANPVLAFGRPGSFDAGTVADPWVYDFNGTYYIGYAASPAKERWNATYATTTDWLTFTKSNTVILPQGSAYDSVATFRGAVSRFGDRYYLPYTSVGWGVHFAMATQPAMAAPPNTVNNPDAVFGFYDGFDGSTLDTSKWQMATHGTRGGSVSVSGGYLTLTAPAKGGPEIQEVVGTRSFGPGGVMMEALVRHVPGAGAGATAGEVGLGAASFHPSLRIFDNDSPLSFEADMTNVTGGNTLLPIAKPLDCTGYLLHQIAWAQPGSVAFSVANGSAQTLAANGPTPGLPPVLAAVSDGRATTISVDWVRVRSWVGEEAPATVGPEETASP